MQALVLVRRLMIDLFKSKSLKSTITTLAAILSTKTCNY